jgi:hypothetical protein
LREHGKIGEVKIFAGTPPRFWQQPELPQTAALWRRLEEFLANHLKPHSAAQLCTAAILAHEAGHAAAV